MNIDVIYYRQLTEEEITVHTIYKEFYHPNINYIKYSQEDKYIINEAIGRYCNTHSIARENIFDMSLTGDLIPRKIRHDYTNIESIVSSEEGSMIYWKIKENMREIRTELDARKLKTEYYYEWIGE